MASPMTPTPVYRLAAATSHHHIYAIPTPQYYDMGTVKTLAERTRLIELLRAPNILTSPTIEPSSKGLLNGPGQNNCFLNCAVQLLKSMPPKGYNEYVP
ncbi:uncharacterized protein ACN427_010337 [Glossina fuscipes fuscipes]